MCMGHFPGFAWYGARFSRMFWKIAVWMQSATDDPGFVPLLPWDIGFSTNERVNYRLVSSKFVKGFQGSRMLMCMWGNVYSLRVRGLSRRRH